MKKSTKIWLAIATIWPFAYIFIFFGFMLSMFFMASGSPPHESRMPSLFLLIFPLHLFTILEVMGVMIFYIVNIFHNERVEKDKKMLWTILLFVGGLIAMPVYWYLYIWPEAQAAPYAPGGPAYLNQEDAGSWAQQANSNRREPEREYVPPPEPPNWR